MRKRRGVRALRLLVFVPMEEGRRKMRGLRVVVEDWKMKNR